MESSPGKDGEYENILRRDTLKSEYEPTANKAVISSMNDGNSEATRKPGGTLDREMVKIRGNNMLLLIVSLIIISVLYNILNNNRWLEIYPLLLLN